MKLRINWRVFLGCLAVSFLLAWGVQWLSGLNYWASWGIVMFAWVAVGITTFFDDDDVGMANSKEKPKNSTNA